MFGLVIKKKSTFKKLKAKAKQKSDAVLKLRASLRAKRRDYWDLDGKFHESKDSDLGIAIREHQTVTEATRSVFEKLLNTKRRAAARSIATALVADPLTRGLGNFAFGIFMHREQFFASALAYFDALGTKAALEIAPVEYLESLLDSDRKKGLRLLDSIYGDSPVPVRAELNRLRTKYLDIEPLRSGAAELLASPEAAERLDAGQMQQLKWAHDLLNRAPIKVRSKDAVMIGVMDYKMLDRSRTSSNLGDYVQTLAMLSNLCRFSKPDFDDGSALGHFVGEMQKRVEPAKRIAGPSAKVQLVPVDRDYASGRTYPGPVWMISNGWYMHRNFKGPFDFPFSKNIKPIFISFHLNQADLLTAESAAYLKTCAPIGCRDWTTVYRLRDHGIPSFFSGCLTTTVGTLFPVHTNKEGPTAIVDTKLPEGTTLPPGAVEFSQVGDEVRDLDLVSGLRGAVAIMEKYQDFGKIITSRLHCYLPCRSMGMDVDFRPKNKADVRFEGLLELPEQTYAAMRKGLSEKVTAILEKILSGATEPEVRTMWRELCKKDVAAAEAYCGAALTQPKTSVNIKAAVATLKKNALKIGPSAPAKAMDIAFASDANLAEELLTVLASLVKHNRSPMRIHLMLRGLGTEFAARVKANFPKHSFILYFFDAVDYGDSLRMLSHTTVSTMDRLLLPELLNEQNRVMYLDVDILIRGSLAALYNVDLKGHPVAAKMSTNETWSSGLRLVTRASLSLPHEKAWELRRRMHALGPLQFSTFNAGVLVLDLERLRRDKFTEFALPLIELYAFNDQDALNLYVRGKFRQLEKKWNFVPNQDWCENPGIVHWAGQAKPWQAEHVAYKAEFLAYREQLLK